jgi:hypothetical protein
MHICKLPLNQCSDATREAKKRKNLLALPRAVSRMPWVVRQTLWDLTAYGAVRPLEEIDPAPNFSKTTRTTLNTFQMLPSAQIMQKLLPLADKSCVKKK